MKPARIWQSLGVTKNSLDEKACWLSEQRELDDPALFFFREAGKLVEFSWYHYPFSSLAFFQGVIGVERTLRLLYEPRKKNFRALFEKLAADSGFTSAATIFSCSGSVMARLSLKRMGGHWRLGMTQARSRSLFQHGEEVLGLVSASTPHPQGRMAGMKSPRPYSVTFGAYGQKGRLNP